MAYEHVQSNAAKLKLLGSGLDTKVDNSIGIAPSALKLAISRVISLTGNVTGSVNFDGSGNAAIATTVVPNSHNHTIANVTGLQAALDAKLATNGNGSALTALNAANLSSGIVPDARLSGTYNGVNITGNAATATKLQTARTINGVAFDGTANISIATADASKLPLAGGTLTGKEIISINQGANPTYSLSQLELNSGGANPVALGFHRPGATACALVHAGDGLRLESTSWGSRASFAAGAIVATGDITSSGSVYASSWLRTYGQTGWFSQDYGGGFHMTDTTWVRVYNGKALYVPNTVAATGDVIAYYSDERLKENVRPLEGALKMLRQFGGVRYNANELGASFGYDPERQEIGYVAQQVKSVLPEVVSLAPFDMTDKKGESLSGENYLTLKYDRILPVVSEAVKEVDDKVEVDRKALNGLIDVVEGLVSKVAELERKLQEK